MKQLECQDALRSFACEKEKPQPFCFYNQKGESIQLTCRQLWAADYEEVRGFEVEIVAGIANNDVENIYQPFDEAGLRKALATGWAVGLYDADRLAAFLYVIPHPQPDHNVLLDVAGELGSDGQYGDLHDNLCMDLGNDFGNGPVADLGDVMIADCILVRKEYRGFGLQRALFYLAERLAEREGISRLCGTASPKNAHSIRNFEAAGYRCVAVKPKYRSERCFFVKQIALTKSGSIL